MNNMEIKQGDKVRVSKDAPRIYTPDWIDVMFDLVLKVTEVEDGNAMVEFEKRTPYKTVLTTIPTKYLVKVDAEAKEAKFKIGDRVRNIESGVIGVVDQIVYGNVVWVNGADGKRYHWKSDGLELIKPTEQAEEPNHTIRIPVEVDLTDSYWDAYTADLAKEVAVMLVRTHRNDLNKVAKMSVDIAKAVVEGLKRK